MLMKVYESDPLAKLLAILYSQGNKTLMPLLETIAYQTYGMTLSLVSAKYTKAAGIKPRKEAC